MVVKAGATEADVAIGALKWKPPAVGFVAGTTDTGAPAGGLPNVKPPEALDTELTCNNVVADAGAEGDPNVKLPVPLLDSKLSPNAEPEEDLLLRVALSATMPSFPDFTVSHERHFTADSGFDTRHALHLEAPIRLGCQQGSEALRLGDNAHLLPVATSVG